MRPKTTTPEVFTPTPRPKSGKVQVYFAGDEWETVNQIERLAHRDRRNGHRRASFSAKAVEALVEGVKVLQRRQG
jgi:hypothetical protein